MSELNILMIDDDVVDVLDVERALRRRGISNPLKVARDGVHAMDMLLGRDGHAPLPAPRIILLDLNMPRMDGFEFLRELRSHPDHEDDPVFVLTTSDDDRHRAQAHALGISGYIVKDEVPMRALDLVLQALQELPPAEISTVEVSALVRGIATRLDPDGRFKLVLPASILLLETAVPRLERVLHCLIENCIEHHDRDHGRIKVAWEERGDVVHFRVTDDGPGIPTFREREVLRPLDTTKADGAGEPVAGEGMGLPLAAHIVSAAGGTLAVQGTLTRGTTVSFTWPLTWAVLSEVPMLSLSPLDEVEPPDPSGDSSDLGGHSAVGGVLDSDGPAADFEADRSGDRAVQPAGAQPEPRGLPYDVVLAAPDELDRISMRRAFRQRGHGRNLHLVASADEALAALRALGDTAPASSLVLLLDAALAEGPGGGLLDALRADPELSQVAIIMLVEPSPQVDALLQRVGPVAAVASKEDPGHSALLHLLERRGGA